MKAEIISVGTELLLGQITNTNAQIISRELQKIGVDVYYHTSVGDNRERLMEVFHTAWNRSEAVILTGGLGPTQDDLTKETISEYLNLPLVLDESSLARIREFFEKRGREMPDNNLKQALLPEGSIAIPNDKGTAPGVLLEWDGRIVVMLPGPPFEMEPMLKAYVIPYISKKSSGVIFSRVLKFYGIGESTLEEKIKDLIESQTNPTIAPLAKMGEVTLRITAKACSIKEAMDMIAPVELKITERVGEYLYAYDDEKVEEIVARLLLRLNKTIAIAESCTGGLVSHKLTEVPGISKSLDRAIVSYSNRAKEELLFVKRETLEKYGAVSEQTALEMADGVRRSSETDLGLSITGIAGPEGGTAAKPVGLVYIAYSDASDCIVERHLFSGNRSEIKERAANAALHLLRKSLLK
ncbi:competence/damage-inducible protein A [Thermosediminibacter oceani]|uniref:Putative competence-damage inducible protein n=1 Tax=Thermosediminibacter oceani (strain ATCC BAA-1034 / DSM 16646 / JW/IW-1228P) TaxID=555079 RepID=D9S3J8_THEOJ|nr:competence/damage-inducible protein A [Thermosediminibacter oceani]ADL07975.1 competence/damage-inducible protein cinA [Thermosediminibacter oceani DSM 16646]